MGFFASFGFRQRLGIRVDLAVEGLQEGSNTGVTVANFLLVDVVQLQGLAQNEELFRPPGAFEALNDLFISGLDPRIFQF